MGVLDKGTFPIDSLLLITISPFADAVAPWAKPTRGKESETTGDNNDDADCGPLNDDVIYKCLSSWLSFLFPIYIHLYSICNTATKIVVTGLAIVAVALIVLPYLDDGHMIVIQRYAEPKYRTRKAQVCERINDRS